MPASRAPRVRGRLRTRLLEALGAGADARGEETKRNKSRRGDAATAELAATRTVSLIPDDLDIPIVAIDCDSDNASFRRDFVNAVVDISSQRPKLECKSILAHKVSLTTEGDKQALLATSIAQEKQKINILTHKIDALTLKLENPEMVALLSNRNEIL